MNLILDLLFPKKCVGCKKLDTFFCEDCISNILQKNLICPECERLSLGGKTHSVCRKRSGLDGLWSLGWYQGPLKKSIKQFKYQRVSNIAETLSDLLVDYWIKFQPLVFDLIEKNKKKWLVIPVPLHWWRENNRGFNQVSLIGQILSKKLGLDYCEALKRTRYTKSQAALKGQDRHQNIKNAFALSPDCNLSPDACILLIDDVWTTGSTLRECCEVLKKNGAKQVWAITLAR
ncbi:MAG: ComF family protein [Candidatus Daviesbacteria bacterium]|nr:ComF family protein [Candidatus Daviesbacteria bacterium]